MRYLFLQSFFLFHQKINNRTYKFILNCEFIYWLIRSSNANLDGYSMKKKRQMFNSRFQMIFSTSSWVKSHSGWRKKCQASWILQQMRFSLFNSKMTKTNKCTYLITLRIVELRILHRDLQLLRLHWIVLLRSQWRILAYLKCLGMRWPEELEVLCHQWKVEDLSKLGQNSRNYYY